MKYLKNLSNYIRERCPNIDNEGLDLLEGLLAYNPDRRLSAKEALAHPWFRSCAPFPCQPFQIQKMDKDYHDYMHRAEWKEKMRREKLERIEYEKRENERNKSRWHEGEKKSEKKEGASRLASLLALGALNAAANGNGNNGTTSAKKDFVAHKGSKDYTDRDPKSRDRSRIESRDDGSVIIEKEAEHQLSKRKPEKLSPDRENTNQIQTSD